MTIIANYHEDIGCSYHRIHLPMKYMSYCSNVSVAYITARDFPLPETYFAQRDLIFFFNRVPTCSRELLLSMRTKYGFKIVVDIDDHWILYPHHEMAAAWKESKAHEQIQNWIIDADMVFTTNERLKVAANHLNSNVHVIPNTIPMGYEQFKGHRIPNPRVYYTYAAGSSHLYDLSLLKPVMKRLGNDQEFVNNAGIMLAGYDHSYGTANVNSVWPKMLNIIRPAKSFSTVPARRVGEYMASYADSSVALAPLERSTFNACKSNLKILEAGCMGIPVIASYVEPYIQDAKCPGVLLCDTSKDWYQTMKMLLNDKTLRINLGGELMKYVNRYYSMDEANNNRLRKFESLF